MSFFDLMLDFFESGEGADFKSGACPFGDAAVPVGDISGESVIEVLPTKYFLIVIKFEINEVPPICIGLCCAINWLVEYHESRQNCLTGTAH